MRASRASGRPDLPYPVAFPDLLPGLHVDRRQVKVHADEAVTVINENRIAREEEVLASATVPSATASTGAPAGTG